MPVSPASGRISLLLFSGKRRLTEETMRSHGTGPDLAAGDVTSAVLAIGRPDFAKVLIDTLRRQADVRHCMVFALSRNGAAHCLLDAGNIPIGGDLGAAYAGQFHESDPNRDALFEAEGSAPIMLPAFAPRMYGARYRKSSSRIPASSTNGRPRSGPATPASTSTSIASARRAVSAPPSAIVFRRSRPRSRQASPAIFRRQRPTSPRCSRRAHHFPR